MTAHLSVEILQRNRTTLADDPSRESPVTAVARVSVVPVEGTGVSATRTQPLVILCSLCDEKASRSVAWNLALFLGVRLQFRAPPS